MAQPFQSPTAPLHWGAWSAAKGSLWAPGGGRGPCGGRCSPPQLSSPALCGTETPERAGPRGWAPSLPAVGSLQDRAGLEPGCARPTLPWGLRHRRGRCLPPRGPEPTQAPTAALADRSPLPHCPELSQQSAGPGGDPGGRKPVQLSSDSRLVLGPLPPGASNSPRPWTTEPGAERRWRGGRPSPGAQASHPGRKG